MEGIVITSSKDSIRIDFNDLSTYMNLVSGVWMKNRITSVKLPLDLSCVNIVVDNEKEFVVSFNGAKGLPVKSVDGITPTDNQQLFDLIDNIL